MGGNTRGTERPRRSRCLEIIRLLRDQKNVRKAVGQKSGSGWKVRWNAGGEETSGWENKGIPQMQGPWSRGRVTLCPCRLPSITFQLWVQLPQYSLLQPKTQPKTQVLSRKVAAFHQSFIQIIIKTCFLRYPDRGQGLRYAPKITLKDNTGQYIRVFPK